MTNVAMGTKGSSIQYTQQGQVEGLSIKIEQDELCIEDELADSIWKHFEDKNGYISIEEAKNFSLKYFKNDNRFNESQIS